MTFLAIFPPVSSAILLLALAILLLRSAYGQYPLLFAYCFVELAIIICEGVVFFSVAAGGSRAYQSSLRYAYVYWSGDLLHDLMLFLLVITLTYKTLEGSPMRSATGRVLTIIGVAAVALPFVLFHPFFTARWFGHASQLLSLGAAAMNLLLWTAIIGTKKRDPQLLMVSAGVGIAVTGLAISWGLALQFPSNSVRWLIDLLHGLTHVAGNAIWCWAFRPALNRQPDRSTGHPVASQA